MDEDESLKALPQPLPQAGGGSVARALDPGALPSRSREGLGEGITDQTTIRTKARLLRRDSTEAERVLWRAISARKVCGVRFNRQVVIGPFICDFAARGIGLVIEVDGGQHGWRSEEDARRTALIEAQGFKVIRFWNDDVFERLEGVILSIGRAIAALPSPSPSREREGRF